MEHLSAEQAVVGAMLVNNDLVPQALSMLTAEDFLDVEMREAFRLAEKAYRDGGAVDVVSLGKIPGIGRVVAGLPRIHSLSAWAKTIRDAAAKRRLGRLLAETSEGLDEGDVYETISALSANAADIARHARSATWLDNVALTKEALASIDKRATNESGMVGLPTGLLGLDLKLSGLRPGQLIGIGGRPGAGKTALLQQIARHIARTEHVGLVSLEMSAAELTEREVASTARVNLADLYLSHRKDDEMGKIAKAAGDAMRPNLHKAEGSFTLAEIESLAVEAVTRWKVAALFVDYLQLIQTPREVRRHEALAEVCRGLKGLAMKLKIPVVMAMQLNRSPEARQNKRPALSDISETDAPARDCHAVILISKGKDDTELIVEKNRSGFVGVTHCTFRPAYATFEDPE